MVQRQEPTGMVLPPAGNPSFVVSPVCVTHGKPMWQPYDNIYIYNIYLYIYTPIYGNGAERVKLRAHKDNTQKVNL